MKDSNNQCLLHALSMYFIPLYFSVQKNPETKEIRIISTVFRVSAYVSIDNFLVQDFTGSNMRNVKIMN